LEEKKGVTMPMVLVHYEEETDIAYIQLQDGEVAKSKIIDDTRWVDLAQDGSIIGLQIFEASKKYPNLKREAIEKELVGAYWTDNK
jgi:uncharacterized protein YuzE